MTNENVNEPGLSSLELRDEPSKKALTEKNKQFLEYLSEGKTTLEAYKLSGYKGNNHAAYELRSQLSKVYEELLQAKGLSRADMMLAVKRLTDLPLAEGQTSVTLKQKIDILSLWAKVLPKERQADKPAITAFIINPARPTANEAVEHIETTVEDPNNA